MSRQTVVGVFAFVPLLQHRVEAAQRRQLQREAQGMNADAHQSHDAGMLQRMQHAGLLTELREAATRVDKLQVLHHGV